ncbi:MAG: hypothetical protein C4537_07765 [Acholeplasma sp.]|jgi:uncharacterized membrane protein|nr:MAG: hypothetical protein C4537_07765 [Acholeplasma sp.]
MNKKLISWIYKIYIAFFIIFTPKMKMFLEHEEIIVVYIVLLLNLIIFYFILAKIFDRKTTPAESYMSILYILSFVLCSYIIEIVIRNGDSSISLLSITVLFLLSYPVVKEYLKK